MGKRFSAAAYDLPPASQMRCNDFLRACGIYVVLCMERAKGIEPSTYSLGTWVFVNSFPTLAVKPVNALANGINKLWPFCKTLLLWEQKSSDTLVADVV